MITNFEFNGSTARQEGLLIEKFVSLPTGIQRYTEYEIPGRDGKLSIAENTYDDVVINVDLLYLDPPVDLRRRYHETKRWLMAGRGKLRFSDQADGYYVVKRVEVADNTIELLRCGRFSVSFTCYPFRYYDAGDIPIPLQSWLYNPYDTSHPMYNIVGEGVCVLNVNGKEFTANVGQKITLDSDLMIAYRTHGTEVLNTAVYGDYMDLWLMPGGNRLSATNGFTVEIMPRWRCL